VFERLLEQYFDGAGDPRTLELLQTTYPDARDRTARHRY